MTFKPWDIVLIRFPISQYTQKKATSVVSSETFNSGDDIDLCF